MIYSVGFLVFFFDLENFTDRIMVVLTTMLVIAMTMASIQGVSIRMGERFILLDITRLFNFRIGEEYNLFVNRP